MPPATTIQPAPSQAASATRTDSNHSTAGDPLAAHADRQYPEILLVATVFVVAFISGYATSLLWHRDRVNREANRQAKTFLSEAIHQGILRVDYERLAELQRQCTDDRTDQPTR